MKYFYNDNIAIVCCSIVSYKVQNENIKIITPEIETIGVMLTCF